MQILIYNWNYNIINKLLNAKFDAKVQNALFCFESTPHTWDFFQSGEPLLAMILSAARGNKCVDTGVGGGGGDILAVLIECDETNFTT